MLPSDTLDLMNCSFFLLKSSILSASMSYGQHALSLTSAIEISSGEDPHLGVSP